MTTNKEKGSAEFLPFVLVVLILIGALATLLWVSYSISWANWQCKKNKEYIENLPTHIECIHWVHVLDEDYNYSYWECSLQSDSNRISGIPACVHSYHCDADIYSMEDCIKMMCDIRVREKVVGGQKIR